MSEIVTVCVRDKRSQRVTIGVQAAIVVGNWRFPDPSTRHSGHKQQTGYDNIDIS